MFKKQAIIAIVLVAVMLLFLSVLLPCGMSLFIKDQSGRVYFEKNVRDRDMVTLGFNHSVEKVLVFDTFLVQPDGSLLLVNTTFGSSGAGLPSETFYNITTDGIGNFTINNINQTFASVNFMTGPTPRHYLIVSGEYTPIFSLVPEGKPLILSVEHNTPASLLINSIRTYI
jgi:hypothetical protein